MGSSINSDITVNTPSYTAAHQNGSFATVQLGETNLQQVARRLNVDADALLLANPQIQDPYRLKVGQEIHLPEWQSKATGSGPEPQEQQNTVCRAPSPIGDPLAAGVMCRSCPQLVGLAARA